MCMHVKAIPFFDFFFFGSEVVEISFFLWLVAL